MQWSNSMEFWFHSKAIYDNSCIINLMRLNIAPHAHEMIEMSLWSEIMLSIVDSSWFDSLVIQSLCSISIFLYTVVCILYIFLIVNNCEFIWIYDHCFICSSAPFGQPAPDQNQSERNSLFGVEPGGDPLSDSRRKPRWYLSSSLYRQWMFSELHVKSLGPPWLETKQHNHTKPR